MVYQGKPSAGCANCRRRKIKCDEGVPACSQCVNTKRTCPGYTAPFDLIFRDQTKAVRRKALRKKQDASASSEPLIPAPATPHKSRSPERPSGTHASADLYKSTSSAIVTRSDVDPNAMPGIFNDLPEQQAICAFFLDFVFPPRHPDSVRGHLEHLLPLYQKASSESPLSLATSSVALALSGNGQNRPTERGLVRTIFGRALRKTSAAIRDPSESLKDETLMAVLLLGLFERISSASEASQSQSKMTSTHNAGAAALVKHRGKDNCKSPLAVGLLFAVRTQLVEHAIEESIAFKRCPDGLSAIFKELPQNAAARLTSVTINIADLRSCAKSALLLPRSTAAEKEVNDLLEYAISIDLLVTAWPESVPKEWNWTSATHFDPPEQSTHGYTAAESAFQYSPHNHIYLDLWVMSIWNQYRSARIKIQSIILSCIAWLGPDHDAHWYWRSIYAKMITQQMTDDICASVPFALGTKIYGGPLSPDTQYPYVLPDGKASDDHRRAASALGGWHLLDPLRSCIRAAAAPHSPDVLRGGQSAWCADQMERIGRIYALQGGRGMGQPSRVWDRYSFEFPV